MFENKKINKIWVISIAVSLVVLASAILSWCVFVKKTTDGNFINLDSWSSFWGGIIGAALTILGAYWVLRLQLDYEEDKRTDEEKTKLKEFENNEIARKKDNVDNTFFNLLNLLFETKNKLLNIEFVKNGSSYSLLQEMRSSIELEAKKWESEIFKEKLNDNRKGMIIQQTIHSYYDDSGSFLRLFQQILKYINDNVEEEATRKNYLNFLHSILDEDLMILIFYTATYHDLYKELKKELLGTNFFGTVDDFDHNKTHSMNNSPFIRSSLLIFKKDDIEKMKEYTSK